MAAGKDARRRRPGLEIGQPGLLAHRARRQRQQQLAPAGQPPHRAPQHVHEQQRQRQRPPVDTFERHTGAQHTPANPAHSAVGRQNAWSAHTCALTRPDAHHIQRRRVARGRAPAQTETARRGVPRSVRRARGRVVGFRHRRIRHGRLLLPVNVAIARTGAYAHPGCLHTFQEVCASGKVSAHVRKCCDYSRWQRVDRISRKGEARISVRQVQRRAYVQEAPQLPGRLQSLYKIVQLCSAAPISFWMRSTMSATEP
jgi:hypothetical protein